MEKDKNSQEYISGTSKYDIINETDVKNFMAEIPEMPSKDTIKKLLLQLPRQITFSEESVLYYKKEIADKKVFLKSIKNELENLKSEIRKKELDNFHLQNDEFIKRTQELMKQLMENKEESASMKKMYFQEVTKIIRPDKPTKSELDDIANLESLKKQNEINALEKEISDLMFELEVVEAKKDFYENVWITIRNYQKIVVAEMQMLGEH